EAERPEGLSPEETYANRCNLLYFVPGQNGIEKDGLALNAHIDVVKPYYPPKLSGEYVFGRGSGDDKGSVVTIITALKVLSEALANCGMELKRNLLGMFVVEEETGGNGSLSLAIDKSLKEYYSSILVMESADNGVFPANRGAVWYQIGLQCPDANLFEMAAFIYEQLELEGRAIKAESRHALFPQRPVQTCHGMIGGYGEHPSRICGEVAFDITVENANSRVQEIIEDDIESALADYIGLYGDKTKAVDKATGKPKVDHHYDLRLDGNTFTVSVHGSAGHMGSIMENDGAITKMAMFVRRIFRSKAHIKASGGGVCSMSLHGEAPSAFLKLEGGQGFVPTHPIDEIMSRITLAAKNGAANYCRLAGVTASPSVEVTFDKLHNAAFDGDPDSTQMKNAIAAAKEAGIWRDDKPIMGWTVSCDSRIFACEYPEMAVITSGGGSMQCAHGDAECIKISEMLASALFTAIYIIKEVGIA
ncbi:MAG: M20/M25/M40 family metallo-hydrolase, partial [Victivallales bacterium]|nr:M20/M25/M40 family metallo-hydrolase [Victivallales bacterium]